AQHESIRRLQLLPAPLVADVAIVLLIAAVELQQLGVVVADGTGERIGQTLGDAAAQEATDALDVFEMGGHGDSCLKSAATDGRFLTLAFTDERSNDGQYTSRA